jgi:hypothetical protein
MIKFILGLFNRRLVRDLHEVRVGSVWYKVFSYGFDKDRGETEYVVDVVNANKGTPNSEILSSFYESDIKDFRYKNYIVPADSLEGILSDVSFDVKVLKRWKDRQ